MSISKFLILILIILLALQQANGQEHVQHVVESDNGPDRYVTGFYNISNSSDAFAGLRLRALNREGTLVTYSGNYTPTPGYAGITDLNNSQGVHLRSPSPSGVIRLITGGSNLSSHTRLMINGTGNVGIGTGNAPPKAKLQIHAGYLYMSDLSQSKIVMRSSNGSCWELKVDNSGTLTTGGTTCP